MTPEAQKLLTWIEYRGAITRWAVRVYAPPQYRQSIRWALDELLSAGYVVRDNDGWYRPANNPSKG